MNDKNRESLKTIMNLEMLNTLNEEGCPACGRKFTLGEPVVVACGDWGPSKKLIHENEAVYDKKREAYFEKSCYQRMIAET